jgi:very-short-patch-repair endonuclease
MNHNARPEARLLEQQWGVISRSQAFATGVSPSGLRHRLRPGGPWQSLLPGVYLTVTGQPTREQREMAALLYAGDPSAITGISALRFWQLPGLPPSRVDTLVPDARQRSSRGYVRICRTKRMPERVAIDRALEYVLPARAVLDTVRGMTEVDQVRELVAAVVQQRVCKIELLRAELPAVPVRGTAVLREVLAEIGSGVRSGPEADLRRLIIRARLPMPLFNCSLRLNGQFLAKPDAYWPDHGVVGEVDSWQWHSRPEAWSATLDRHNRIEAAGLRVLHFSPRQIRTQPEDVISKIAAALGHGRPAPGIVATPVDA